MRGRDGEPAIVVWRRAIVGAGVRGEGGVDGGDHVVLVVLDGVGVAGLHAAHVCLHGEQRAVHGQLLVVGNVHAAKVATGVSAVDDMAVGEDVGEGALLAKLAVSLWAARSAM